MKSDCSTNSSLPPSNPAPEEAQYKITVKFAGSFAELVKVVTDAGLALVSVGEGRKASLRTERDAEIIRKYAEDPKKHNTVTMAKEYGLSRERIAQILRPTNVMAYEAERRAAAKAEIQQQKSELKQELKENLSSLIDKAIGFMQAEKLSIRQAVRKLGRLPHSHTSNLISLELRKRGFKHNYGRHRDFSERRATIERLHTQGLGNHKIVAHMRANGDPQMNYNWILEHMAHLTKPRQKFEARKKSGANGMTEGDRVVHEIDGKHGVAQEFLQDGDCQVTFDDGSTKMVKWNNLHKE